MLAPSEVLLALAPSEGQRLLDEWLVAWVLADDAFATVAPSEVALVAPSEDAAHYVVAVGLDQ